MAEKTLEYQNTLVRYNNPTLVIKHDDKKSDEVPKSPRPVSGGIAIGDTRKETEEILNSILPPKCWEGLEKFFIKVEHVKYKKFFNFQRTVNCGAKQYQAHLLLVKMLSISKRCSILASNKCKLVKLEFVQLEPSFIVNALVILLYFNLCILI